MLTASWTWNHLCKYLGADLLYSPALPLGRNPWLPLTMEGVVQRTLARHNLRTMGDFFPNGHVITHDPLVVGGMFTTMDHFVLRRL